MSSKERMRSSVFLLLPNPSTDPAPRRTLSARQAVARVWDSNRRMFVLRTSQAFPARTVELCLESATLVKPPHPVRRPVSQLTSEKTAFATSFRDSAHRDNPWHKPCEPAAQTIWFNCAPPVGCLAPRRLRPSGTNLNRESAQNSFGCQQRERLQAEARCCRPVHSGHQPRLALPRRNQQRTEGTEQRT